MEHAQIPKKDKPELTDEAAEAFFASAPAGGYEGYFAPPSANETLDTQSEETKLVEARAMLDAAIEDAPTEETNIVPLQPKEEPEAGYGALAEDFFARGVTEYGADATDDEQAQAQAAPHSDEDLPMTG